MPVRAAPLLTLALLLACSSAGVAPTPAPPAPAHDAPDARASNHTRVLGAHLQAHADALWATARALAEQLPWTRCESLPPGSRLAALRILSGPDGQALDAAPERSTVDVPVWLVAEVTVALPDGSRRVLRGDGAATACIGLVWRKIEPAQRWHSNKDDDGRTRFTPLAYTTAPLATGWRVQAEVHPSHLEDQFADVPTGVGVMHYQLVARLGDDTLETPGDEARDRFGSLDGDLVHRVSYRPDTGSWVDYAFELFNTPYVWGSVGPQVDGQRAADCADLAVYAWRRAGHPGVDYTWSYGMRHVTRLRSEVVGIDAQGRFLDPDGAHLVFGRDAHPGDIILLRRHIAVLYADDGDGVLDVDDQLVQTNWHEPELVSFARMRYDHDAFELRAWPDAR